MSSPLSIAAKSPPTTSTSSPSPGSSSASGSSSTPLGSSSTPADDPQLASTSFPEPPSLPPLHRAAQTGDLSTLLALLPPGCDESLAREVDGQGITALHWAAINNQLQAAKILLERGAQVDAVGGDLSATPLHWAAR